MLATVKTIVFKNKTKQKPNIKSWFYLTFQVTRLDKVNGCAVREKSICLWAKFLKVMEKDSYTNLNKGKSHWILDPCSPWPLACKICRSPGSHQEEMFKSTSCWDFILTLGFVVWIFLSKCYDFRLNTLNWNMIGQLEDIAILISIEINFECYLVTLSIILKLRIMIFAPKETASVLI